MHCDVLLISPSVINTANTYTAENNGIEMGRLIFENISFVRFFFCIVLSNIGNKNFENRIMM